MTIFYRVLDANKQHNKIYEYSMSSVWNAHNSRFTNQSQCYKDSLKLADELKNRGLTNINIYAVVTRLGKSQHSRSEVLIIAIHKDAYLESLGRIQNLMISI